MTVTAGIEKASNWGQPSRPTPTTLHQLSGWTPASNLAALCLLSAVLFLSIFCRLLSAVICLPAFSCEHSPRRRNVERKAASECLRIVGSASAISCCQSTLVTGLPNGRLLTVLRTAHCRQVPYRASGRMGQIPSNLGESAESECIAIFRDVRLSPSIHQRLVFFLAPRNHAPEPSTFPQHTNRAFNRIHPRGPVLPVSTKIYNPPICICTILYLCLDPLATSRVLLLSPIPTTYPCARVPRYLDRLPHVGLTTWHTSCFTSLLP